jgi:hypothetical protein
MNSYSACFCSTLVRKNCVTYRGGREEVFVMQPAKDRIGTDGIRFSAAMAPNLEADGQEW